MATADSLIDRWLDLPGDSPERAAIEAELRRGPYGSMLLDLARELSSGAPPEPDVARGIDQLLPAGGPELYRQIGSLVLRAWQDVVLREHLRSAPRAILEREGIHLPPSLEVAIVQPQDARLPTAHAVALPLPPASSPAATVDRAREALDATPFGALIGLQSAHTHPAMPLGPSGSRLDDDGTRIGPRPARVPWAALGLAAAAVIVVVLALPAGPSGLVGAVYVDGALTPVGAAMGLLAAALALLAVALAAGRRP